MLVSVIIPVGRDAGVARQCVEGVAEQESDAEVEIVLVGAGLDSFGAMAIIVPTDEINPAVRRNLGAAAAGGDVLAFIDDDAIPEPFWISRALDELREHPAVVVVGGPDPAPEDSSAGELLSDTVLAAPLFGSGVLAHQGGDRRRVMKSPGDLALVNLFIRRDVFHELGGFDESIGYVGEDSDLIARAMALGEAVYRPDVVVRHRRRSFPLGYVKQRFRYRVKTGQLLAKRGSIYRRNPKIIAFLSAAPLCVILVLIRPESGIVLGGIYVVGSLMSGVMVTKLPWYWWPVLPFAFALHHATYLAGLLTGLVRGALERLAKTGETGREQENQ